MRIIPGKTKIRIELFKGVTLADFLIGLVFAGGVLLTVTSTLTYKLYVAAAILFVGVLMLVKIGDEPNYMFFLSIIRHMSYRKTYSKAAKRKRNIANISAFTGIEDGYIVYDGYYGAALEIPPVEFRFFSSYRRSMTIDECLGNVLRSLSGSYSANIVKIERRVPYDGYIANERKKLEELRHSFECALISEEEYQSKCEVIFDRMSELETMNSESRTVAPYYYIVFFDENKNQLKMQLQTAYGILQRGEMQPKRLNSRELALFLKYTNDIDFNEKELDGLQESEYAQWAMPDSLRIKAKNYILNDITAYTMAINNYPLMVGDAWLAGVMSIPATKVVVKLRPMDKIKTVRNIDRSISELRARYNQSGVDSTLIELANHIESLSTLLSMLQSDNEVLLNTNVYVTCYDAALTKKEGREQAVENTSRAFINNMRSVVKRNYREDELRLSSLQFNQVEGYVGSQISGYDPLARSMGRGIPGATAAAMYPWIFAHVQDPKGVKLGTEDGIPVFIDMFRRDSERVNSNMVIVGKSGSGKSYAAKSILVNLAADNSKIFVLDPENEYTELAENLHGKFINVGNAQQGRMNPFQIITALDDDTDGADEGETGSYASHMQFLEEFFRQILPDCEKEALEYLNTLTDRVYMNRGITAETKLKELSAEDYPIFDDLYDEILKEFQSTDNEYLRAILRTLMNYVSKFSTGGRNANIWNGPSTISTDENFTVFNFQSLLSGGNQTITNAQMLLVMKYINNEIIKNREYNTRFGTNRKIVVVIDEAHVFIDEKYPIALDFMFQLAKRIRKYNGMQIVITQNIKDFVGSEELSRKSSAIINACQYSFIFPLAPNDMADLCKLYEKAGGINENEQDKIVTAPRGNAFVVLSPTSRSSFQVEVPDDVKEMFRQRGFISHYFSGEDGQAAWEDYLGGSREKYLANRRVQEQLQKEETAARAQRISLVEISEEEYEQEMARQRAEQAEKLSFTELVEEKSAEEKTPEAPQPVVRDAAPEVAGMVQMLEQMRQMMESIGRFSYDAVVNDIMGRIGAAGGLNTPAAQTSAYTAAAQVSAAKEERPAVVREKEKGESSAFDFLAGLLVEDEDTAEAEKNEVEEDDTMSLEQLLMELEADEDNMSDITAENEQAENEPEDDSDESSFSLFDEADDDSFDIMSFIEKSSAELDYINVLDEMRNTGENKRIITLEELIKLNQMRKNS